MGAPVVAALLPLPPNPRKGLSVTSRLNVTESFVQGRLPLTQHSGKLRAGALCWPLVAKDILYACPFCRQLFQQGEVEICPDCELPIQPLDELPPSYEAKLLDPPPEAQPPEMESLPWTYLGRGRGLLLLLAVAGIGAFFAPWLNEQAPEVRVLSGFAFARHLGWLWAAGVAWFIMLPLVASRRTIYHMRGARLAVALLAAMVLMTVVLRLALTPPPSPLVPRRFEWGWGLYASGLLAVAALVAGLRFGGSLVDMPTRQGRRGDETLH